MHPHIKHSYNVAPRPQGTTIKPWYVIAAGLAIWLFLFGGLTSVTTYVTSLAPQQVAQTPPSTAGFINYNVGFTFSETISTSGGAASTTSPVYAAYHSTGRRLSGVSTLYGETGVSIASGTTATSVAVYPTDNDFFFLRIYPGTAEYPDVAKTLKANPALVSYKWLPVSTATNKEFVAELQISKLGKPNYDAGTNAITTQLLVSVMPDDLAVTMSAPADQDSIGTTSGTDVYFTWELTALAANQALSLARIYFTSNQTSSLIDIIDIEIASSSRVVNMPTFTDQGTTIQIVGAKATSTSTSGITQFWRFSPSNADQATDYSETLLIPRGSSDADSIRIKVHVKTYFAAATDAATIVLGIRAISANNALQTAVTDTAIAGG